MAVLDALPFVPVGPLSILLFLEQDGLNQLAPLPTGFQVGFTRGQRESRAEGGKRMRAGILSSGLLLCGMAAFLYGRPLHAPHQTAAISKFGTLLHPLPL